MRTLPLLLTRCAAVCALGLLPAIGTAAAIVERIPLEAAPDQGDFLYKVKPGETMRAIATRYLFRASDLGVLLSLNHVRDANRLTPGSTIVIPRRLLMVVPARGVVAAFRGAVSIGGDRQVKVGTVVAEGTRIETGANSAISLTLEDGSTVSLPSQSVIRIDRLRLVLATGELQQVFRLDSGRSDFVASPRKGPASRFEVRTPVSVSAVRGTEFRVGVDNGGAGAVSEVLRDSVAVTAAGAGLTLDQGYGARSSATSAGTAVKLLPPPEVVLPILHKPDGGLLFNIKPLEKAVHYRVQIATDRRFLDVTDEMVSDTPAVTFSRSPVGSFFVRFTAIDANGLEGLPHVYPFVYQPH